MDNRDEFGLFVIKTKYYTECQTFGHPYKDKVCAICGKEETEIRKQGIPSWFYGNKNK